uniref:FGGY carbohydrate kinase domain containing n=1 Tax=Astyanax mexicanus TaxID=7994 RepID=A0A8B9HJV9_ASTMX
TLVFTKVLVFSDYTVYLNCFVFSRDEHVYSFLNRYLEEMSKDQKHLDQLSASLHVWPDFHGNRSPLADQSLKGMVRSPFLCFLNYNCIYLLVFYLFVCRVVVLCSQLGTRHILSVMKEAGHDITTLFLCGGLSKNPLFVQIHANTTGLPVVLAAEREAVLVGAAVLGACASGDCTHKYNTISASFFYKYSCST